MKAAGVDWLRHLMGSGRHSDAIPGLVSQSPGDHMSHVIAHGRWSAIARNMLVRSECPESLRRASSRPHCRGTTTCRAVSARRWGQRRLRGLEPTTEGQMDTLDPWRPSVYLPGSSQAPALHRQSAWPVAHTSLPEVSTLRCRHSGNMRTIRDSTACVGLRRLVILE